MEKISITLARIEKIKNLLECWQQKQSISNIERNIILNLLSASYNDLLDLNTSYTKPAKVALDKIEKTVNETVQASLTEAKTSPKEEKVKVEEELELVEQISAIPKKEQPAEDSKPKANQQEASATTVRLGDKFSGLKKYLNDSFSNLDDSGIAHYSSINDINRAIGINDRFLFIKELFGGDKELFSKTISTLNSCNNIDEALMYIHQNFSWNSEDAAVKQLVLLLYRRFK